MEIQLEDLTLNLFGEEETIKVPHYNMGDYVIRPWIQSDFEEIASFTDPSLAEQLDVHTLESLSEVGYTFEPGAKGVVGFVAVDSQTNEIMGWSYIKTWHGNNFTKPKYKETEKGVVVITAQELMQNATNIVELGGWLVKPEYRGKKIAQGLTYASVDFIRQMQDAGYEADAAFITNVGPLRVIDNDNRTDYGMRMADMISKNGYDPSDLTALANQRDETGEHPVVITNEQFEDIFSDLTTSLLVSGRMRSSKYEFGDPRSATAPAYHISGKLIAGHPLMTYDEEDRKIGLISPIQFEASKEMHPEHGGNYTIAHLRSTSNSK